MVEQPDGEGWPDPDIPADGGDEETDSSTSVDQLSPAEARAVRQLADHDIGLTRIHADALEFATHPKLNPRPMYSTFLDRAHVDSLLQQLDSGVRHSSKWTGIAIPDRGYCEVLIRLNESSPSLYLLRRFSQLVPDSVEVNCRHSGDAGPLALFFPSRNRDSRPVKIHLCNGRICLEVSGPTPACHVLANLSATSASTSVSISQSQPRSVLSIKLDFDERMKLEELEAKTEAMLNSFIYELEVRNGIRLRLLRWPANPDSRRPIRRERPNTVVRFPEIKIEPEVAVLFNFAGSAIDNPPLSFLSYYQVLENFFPIAGRRSALKKLELELSDPRFDKHQDKYLMRLLSVGENAASSSEAVHLRVLLEEFVRGDSLRNFFVESDWGKYFTKTGPIRGIDENINLDNKQKSLSWQVADRVYRIRNRIVHAKDDPKFEDVPALLPQSGEAEALWPDIELVKFLASEVILSAQLRGQ